jgi:hypothetical protein
MKKYVDPRKHSWPLRPYGMMNLWTRNEPKEMIVTVAWIALMAFFVLSIALVVWGRNGF